MAVQPGDDSFTRFHEHLEALAADSGLSAGGIPGKLGIVRGGLIFALGHASSLRALEQLRRWSASHWRRAGTRPGGPEAAWCDLAGISLRLAFQLADESDTSVQTGMGALARQMTVAAHRRFLARSVDPATGSREDYDQALKRVFDENSLRYMERRTMPLYRRLATGAFAAAHADGGASANAAEQAGQRYVPGLLAEVGGIPVPSGHPQAGARVLGRLVADPEWEAEMTTAGAPDRGGSVAAMLATRRFDTLLGLPPRAG